MSVENSLLTMERAHELCDEMFTRVRDSIVAELASQDDWDSWQCREGFLERWHEWRQEAHLLIDHNKLVQQSGTYSTFIESRNRKGTRTPSGGIARDVHLHRRTPLTPQQKKDASRKRWQKWEAKQFAKNNPGKRRPRKRYRGHPYKYREGWKKHTYPRRPKRGRPPYNEVQKAQAALKKKIMRGIQSLKGQRHFWLIKLARHILEGYYVARETGRKKSAHSAWPSRQHREHHTKGEGRGYTPHKRRKQRNPYPGPMPFTKQHWLRMLKRAKRSKTCQKVLKDLASSIPTGL